MNGLPKHSPWEAVGRIVRVMPCSLVGDRRVDYDANGVNLINQYGELWHLVDVTEECVKLKSLQGDCSVRCDEDGPFQIFLEVRVW